MRVLVVVLIGVIVSCATACHSPAEAEDVTIARKQGEGLTVTYEMTMTDAWQLVLRTLQDAKVSKVEENRAENSVRAQWSGDVGSHYAGAWLSEPSPGRVDVTYIEKAYTWRYGQSGLLSPEKFHRRFREFALMRPKP